MGQDRPINALLPGFAQVHVFNSTRIKPFIPVYMPIAMYRGVFAQNTPRSRVSACFHLPSTASTALHVLNKCQTRVRPSEFALSPIPAIHLGRRCASDQAPFGKLEVWARPTRLSSGFAPLASQ